MADYYFQVENHATVVFYHPKLAKNVTVIAHEVTGDKTGIIKLTKRQRLFVFVVESTHTYMDAPCSFFVDDYAEIIFPTHVVLRGETSTIKGKICLVFYQNTCTHQRWIGIANSNDNTINVIYSCS